MSLTPIVTDAPTLPSWLAVMLRDLHSAGARVSPGRSPTNTVPGGAAPFQTCP